MNFMTITLVRVKETIYLPPRHKIDKRRGRVINRRGARRKYILRDLSGCLRIAKGYGLLYFYLK